MSDIIAPKPGPFRGPSIKKEFVDEIVEDIPLADTGKFEKPKDDDKKKDDKKPFVLQPRMTSRPLKGHPGLEDLKKHLGKKQK